MGIGEAQLTALRAGLTATAFSQLVTDSGSSYGRNNRPVQPLGDRQISMFDASMASSDGRVNIDVTHPASNVNVVVQVNVNVATSADSVGTRAGTVQMLNSNNSDDGNGTSSVTS